MLKEEHIPRQSGAGSVGEHRCWIRILGSIEIDTINTTAFVVTEFRLNCEYLSGTALNAIIIQDIVSTLEMAHLPITPHICALMTTGK